jgi:hypothetical protein
MWGGDRGESGREEERWRARRRILSALDEIVAQCTVQAELLERQDGAAPVLVTEGGGGVGTAGGAGAGPVPGGGVRPGGGAGGHHRSGGGGG